MKARGCGAAYTHVQLRRKLDGWEIFLYGWGLFAAAVASESDFALGIDLAARVIKMTAAQRAGVEPLLPRSERHSRPVEDRRWRSMVKKLLSGASMQARERGAIYTHVQLRCNLGGWEIFLYGWGLLAAAAASERDFARGVDLAARVIEAEAAWLAGVEPLVEPLLPSQARPSRPVKRVFPDRRGRSVVKNILAGAASKARGRGAIYTHVQLRRTLVGWQIFLYGWGLLGAAVASTRDFALGVELAARVIEATAAQLVGVARVPS